jgi:hypothetical protein
MKYLACIMVALSLACAGEIVLAQNLAVEQGQYSDPELIFGVQKFDFILYCHQELFPMFEKRRFGLTPLYGQSHSFELWADSINRRYLVSVDIAEQNWEITRQKSIPLLYKKYINDYNIEAYVEVFYRGMAKPILVKKYQITLSGKTSYQLLKGEPDYYKLYVPFKQRLGIENQALRSLAAKVSSDLYNIIN